MAQNEYVVYHSRKNLNACVAVILFGIVAIPYQLIMAVRQHTMPEAGVWTTMIIFVAVTEAVLICGLIKMLFLLAFKPPALIINQKGVFDNVYMPGAVGQIPWSDIAQFEVKESGRTRTLYITPYNRATLLRSKPLFTRAFMLMFRPDVGGGTFKIETRGLAVTADTIRAEMQRRQPTDAFSVKHSAGVQL